MKPLVVSIVVLVTAAALLGASPATVGADPAVPVPFKGRAEYTLTYAAPDGSVLVYNGTGHATHLGLFTADASLFPHGDGSRFSATATFTAANGDQLFLIAEGAFTSPTSVPGTATITGGTGRFEGATGDADFMDITSIVLVDQTFEGTIQY
jgi:hypothetical protein